MVMFDVVEVQPYGVVRGDVVEVQVVASIVSCLTASARGARISSRQRAKWTPVISRSFEHHTGDSTISLSSILILRKKILECLKAHRTSLPFPQTSREDMRLDGYLDHPHAVKTLYIYKQSCLLRDLNPGQNGATISVTNHYTGTSRILGHSRHLTLVQNYEASH
ncbi:uncharacterized protein TNCV_1643431 [Trichonephila clavipes]|nr:uncharacterized protein TNCV_1643431 [Trichonephila clavipes]